MRNLVLASALALLASVLGCTPDERPAAPRPTDAQRARRTRRDPPAPPSVSQVLTRTFTSRALGVDKTYQVYLPRGYARTSLRYPVITMLHGLGGDETDWARHGHLAEAADALSLQAIVVMPDGDDSWYVNAVSPDGRYDTCLRETKPWSWSPPEDRRRFCVRTPRYEDYIARDLIAHIDATYRTIPERRARAIGGLSMGGFGALDIAIKHKDLFASVSSHSGLDALLYAGPHPYERGRVRLYEDVRRWARGEGAPGAALSAGVRAILGPSIERWREHDPSALAAGLHDGELAIYLDCGTEDGLLFDDEAQYLHEVLEQHGVRHELHLLPGVHDWSFWQARIDDSLRFHARALVPPRR